MKLRQHDFGLPAIKYRELGFLAEDPLKEFLKCWTWFDSGEIEE